MPRHTRWATLLAAVFVVAACGSAASPTPQDPAVSPGAAPSQGAPAEVVTLTLETWRPDDQEEWDTKILPAFYAAHPNIKIEYRGIPGETYTGALATKLAGGTAGDLIACTPFDAALGLYKDGHLAKLNDLPGLDNFSPVSKVGWTTDDGKDTYCVPMGSVIHGFIYNADIFAELGLKEPVTQDEFIAVLKAIKDDGRYAPLAIATKTEWESAEMGYTSIGPNYWKGEDGRQGLIAGTAKFTDSGFVQAFEALASWTPYLLEGFEANDSNDSRNAFLLRKAAIFPAGSWEISGFNAEADFKMGFFATPLPSAGQECYVNNHPDFALGMNSKTAHPEETRVFLEWLTTLDFAELYGNSLTGFFPMTSEAVVVDDPLANEFLAMTQTCASTPRLTFQFLSRGTPNLTNELYRITALVLKGAMTPAAAAEEAQNILAATYTP